MFDILNQIGMLGFPLLIIALTVVVLTAKQALALWAGGDPRADIDTILYLGLFSLAMGLFSHHLGMYQASPYLGQMSPEMIAAGYGQSLVALLYGFGIFFVSSICWYVLRFKKRRLEPAHGGSAGTVETG